MKLAFLKPPTRLVPDSAPETPFQKARQEWDTRIGMTVAHARNWRTAFFLMSVFAALVVIALVVQVKQLKVIPVIVGIDREKGEPVVLGRATERQYRPGLPEIRYFLSKFVQMVRAVPSDPVVIKQSWVRAYKFLRPEAAALLNTLVDKDPDSPLKKIGQKTVAVQPLAVTQVPDSDSYQVRWKEAVYTADGFKVDEYTMVAVFTIELSVPQDEATLNENPLGLFVTNFQWNRELN